MMKSIIKRIALLSSFTVIAFAVNGQESEGSESAKSDSPEKMVQLAHRKVASEDVIAPVTVVDMDELKKKSYNLSSFDNLDALAPGWNGTSMWGMDAESGEGYLVLIDGVPREEYTVLPTEIENVTFMKGAAAVVLYGSRATKGVIYITTKRGKVEKLNVSVNVNTGVHFAKETPNYIGSAEYMSLYNEALKNDGLYPQYSPEEIYNYSTGSNPYRYPDVDLFSDEYIKRHYNRTDVSTQITGGTEKARYYTNIGYLHEGDMIDFGEAEKSGVNRLNIRGNVDFQISRIIDAYVNAAASLYDNRNANGDFWGAANSMRPNRIAPLVPVSMINPYAESALGLIGSSANIIDGGYFLAGSQVDQTNIIADYYAGGYNKAISRELQFDTGLNIDLGGITEGLSMGAMFAVDYSTNYTQSYNNTYAVYQPSWSNMNGHDEIVSLTKYGNDEHSGVQNVSNSYERQTVAATVKMGYARTFKTLHNVSAMILATGFQQSITQSYHKPSNANLGMQVGYNYDNKYYADFSGALVHSAKFAKGNRNAFSPSLSLGWNISREEFMSGCSFVDNLKLSASASILHTDLDINDYYLYADRYTNTDEVYHSWADGPGEKTSFSLIGANPDLTFSERREFSANLSGSFFDRQVTAEVSYFVGSTKGGIQLMQNIFPSYISSYYPQSTFAKYMNYNDTSRSGFDAAINYNTKFNEVGFSIGAVASYYKTKATQRDEVFEDGYQSRVGKPADTIWGLESDGFFASQKDIEKSPYHSFGEVSPGDIKYKDQNGDNVIDSRDEVALGEWGAYGSPLTLGVNLTAKWRNITLFALATAKMGSEGMKNSSYYWVQGDMKYSEVVRGRWTPETAATATYPRLTTKSSDNNFRSSDFWLYNNNRFDLAKIQVTYDFPAKLFVKTPISKLSAYVGGYNLLTVAAEREMMETNIYGAPYTRFVNFGVKATF